MDQVIEHWRAGDVFAALQAALGMELFTIAGTVVTVATVLIVLMVLVATLLLSRLVQGGIRRAFERRGVTDVGTIATTSRLAHYVIVALGLAIALDTVGVNLAALFAAGALFAVALGFAMQNIAENFVSGVILLAERAIKPGDVLEVEGRTVRVIQSGIRSTVARTRDEEDLIIPNSTLVSSTVTNFTLRDTVYRVRADVGVVYGSDMGQVRKVLTSTAKAIEWRVRERPPAVLLTGFGDNAVTWNVSVWIDDPWKGPDRRSDLHEALWWQLKEAGIVIAFPQLDVHLDPDVVTALGSGAGPRSDAERSS
ncbi:MAG TPA: mechanosensitive ion channel domain-containing protein [Longimicrobiales bacterium]|nr:mechanosensitive ion channel domain-containing protein [Longimicrobiales bacterium]